MTRILTSDWSSRHEREGIEPIHFAEMLIVSGIVLLDNVKWLSFHSGYDFGNNGL